MPGEGLNIKWRIDPRYGVQDVRLGIVGRRT